MVHNTRNEIKGQSVKGQPMSDIFITYVFNAGLVGKLIIVTTLFKVNMFITNNYNTLLNQTLEFLPVGEAI